MLLLKILFEISILCEIEMQDLFLKYDFDLIKITWAHAVNDKTTLLNALKSDIDCIETDITYCFDDELSYIAHPPIVKSELNFYEFWNLAKQSNKILKLDFKNIEAIEPCLRMLDENDFKRVILNADILPNADVKFKSLKTMEFISLFSKFNAAISIGWLTIRNSSIGYTWSDVIDMNKILNQIMFSHTDQIVSLPVDVHKLSLNSISKFAWLLEQYSGKNVSLTIWCYKDVKINIDCVIVLRKMLNSCSLFMDLPQLLDSERDKILMTKPNSYDHSLKMAAKIIEGDHFWKSNNSFVVGQNTFVEMTLNINNGINSFFIIFNGNESNENYCSTPRECYLMFGSDRISFDEYGYVYYFEKNEYKEKIEICLKKSPENVYYVSIDFDNRGQPIIGSVENYNTSHIRCYVTRGLGIVTSGILLTLIVRNNSSCYMKPVIIDFNDDLFFHTMKIDEIY